MRGHINRKGRGEGREEANREDKAALWLDLQLGKLPGCAWIGSRFKNTSHEE